MKKLVLILLTAAAFSAFAEDEAGNDSTKNEADLYVNVTAARELKETESVPAAVTVISKEDLKGHSVTEALSIYAGIAFSSTANADTAASPVIRGFSENSHGRVLVLIDGVKLNNPDMSAVNWLSIPEERIERVEVIKGGNSALYGNNAVAAVINVITKTPEKGMEVSSAINGGSFSSYGGAVSVSGSNAASYFNLSAEREKSEGWRDRTGYESTDFSGKIGLTAAEKLDSSISFIYSSSEYEMPGSLTQEQYKDDPQDAFNKDDSAKNIFTQINSIISYELNDMTGINLSLAFSNKNNKTDMASYPSYSDTEINVYSASPSVKYEIPGLFWGSSLNIGFDYDKEKFNIKSYAEKARDTKTNDSDLERNTIGVYTRAESYILENLVFSIAARKEFSKLEADFYDESAKDDDKSDSPFVIGTGLSYIFAENSKVYFNYSSIYRYPFFDEQASYWGFATDSLLTDLDPEKGNNFEFGAEYNANVFIQAGVNLFCLFMEDEIAWYSTGYGLVRTGILDKTVHYGAETHLTVTPFEIFSTRFNYNYTIARFTNGDNEDNDLPLTPAHTFAVIPELKLMDTIKIYAEFSYNGEMYEGGDNSNINDQMDSYFLTNAGISASREYKNTDISVSLDVKNLFDAEYVPLVFYSGYYPGSGREIRVGTEFSF